MPKIADIPHKKILVVDDNRIGLRILQHQLAQIGFSVDTASSAEEALALVTTQGVANRENCPRLVNTRLETATLLSHSLTGVSQPLGAIELSAAAALQKAAAKNNDIAKCAENLPQELDQLPIIMAGLAHLANIMTELSQQK